MLNRRLSSRKSVLLNFHFFRWRFFNGWSDLVVSSNRWEGMVRSACVDIDWSRCVDWNCRSSVAVGQSVKVAAPGLKLSVLSALPLHYLNRVILSTDIHSLPLQTACVLSTIRRRRRRGEPTSAPPGALNWWYHRDSEGAQDARGAPAFLSLGFGWNHPSGSVDTFFSINIASSSRLNCGECGRQTGGVKSCLLSFYFPQLLLASPTGQAFIHRPSVEKNQ